MLSSKTNFLISNIVKNRPSKIIQRYVSEASERGAKSGRNSICSPWKICAGVGAGLGARLLYSGTVLCKSHPNSRLIQRRAKVADDSSKFDWKKLLEYLRPHKWLLTAAVAVRSLFR